MIFLVLFSFVKGVINPPEKKPSNIITINVQFVLSYKDGFSRINGTNFDMPIGTTVKQLPHLIREKSSCVHFSVRFIEENGTLSPNVKAMVNGVIIKDDEEDIVIRPRFLIKYFLSINETRPEEL